MKAREDNNFSEWIRSDAAGYASTIQNEKGKQAQFINKPKIIRLVLCSANPAVNITTKNTQQNQCS